MLLMAISWQNRRVLITGGTGFIGSFVAEYLLDAGAKVRIPVRSQNYRSLSERRSEIEWLEGDLRDPAYCQTLVRDIDHVFHLASCRRNIDFHYKRCGDTAAENVRMTLALLDALKEEERTDTSVTFFSTANMPRTIAAATVGAIRPLDGYVLGKSMCEFLWLSAAQQRKFPLLIVRPVGIYGPRDTFAKDGNVIPSLMVKAQSAKDQLEVWGSGAQERTFLYIEDAVKALFMLLDAGAQGVEYLTSSEVITIKTLAETIRDAVHPELPIHFDTSMPEGEPRVHTPSLHECLQDFSWTPFDEGLEKTVHSWRNSNVSLPATA